MKYSREIKVGVPAVICAGILYFGFNFLKCVNIFSPTDCYYGFFERSNGLTEQAPVYILGHKVGLVETVQYDFTKTPAFTIGVNIDKGIVLPRGTEMALIADGLLGGAAIELKIPSMPNRAMPYQRGDTLPTVVTPGLIDNLQTGILAHLDSLLMEANTLLGTLNNEMEQGSLHNSLQHIEHLTANLNVSANDLRQLTHNQLPEMMSKVDTTLSDLQLVMAAVRKAEIENTIAELNTAIQSVNTALKSEDGTLGLLLNDKALYENLNTTLQDLDKVMVNVDSVVMSIKARPFIQKKLKK